MMFVRILENPVPLLELVTDFCRDGAGCVSPVKSSPYENYVHGKVAEKPDKGRMDLCGVA
jgi:hypothetical protein